MPEGPEVARHADQVRALTLGAERLQLRLPGTKIPRASAVAKRLSRRGVTKVAAHGKALLIEFGAETLFVHLQLMGVWVFAPPYPEQRSLRLELESERGAARLYSASGLELLDPAARSEHPYLKDLGPDLLSVEPREVRARLASASFARASLGGLYLRQDFLAGLGNYLRTEILHAARLHPARRAGSLSDAERGRLARESVTLAQQSYRHEGITNQLRRAAKLRRGGLGLREARWLAFEREGLPCYRCQTPLERIEVSTRRLYLCPGCQPSP